MSEKTYSYDEVFAASLDYFHGDSMAATTWIKKYCLTSESGDYLELTPDDMHKRMAKLFHDVEEKYEYNVNPDLKLKLSEYGYKRGQLTEEDVYNLFKEFKYVVPAGSVMSGLGSKLPVSLSNCFVIKGCNDTLEDIFRVCNEQSQLMKRRGGVGFDISGLRPSGSLVNNSAKSSTGAASFMDLFSNVTNTISQNGRRGALMLSISIKHPDAEEFITKKQDLSKVTGANVSVQIDDDFMKAAESNSLYVQRFPVDMSDDELCEGEFDITKYELGKLYSATKQHSYFRVINAADLWKLVIHCAWNTAEPGIIFQTNHYNYSPDGLYESFRGTCTNPCLVGGSLITTKDGDIQIKDIVDKVNNGESVEVLTFNEDTKEIEYKEVENGLLTRKNANVIEIETDDGKTLKLTPDHKVYTENRGWIKASELTETDILISL